MSTDAYLDARAAFERINNEILNLGKAFSAVGSALQEEPGRFIFSNLSSGLPMEASISRDSVSFDANAWPTASAIQEKLASWHRLKGQMEGAWEAVSADRKKGLNPPIGFGRFRR